MSKLFPECGRCKDWERQGLSATCPACDIATLSKRDLAVSGRLEVGAKVMVRDGWIEYDWQVPQGEIVEIGYYKNSSQAMVFLVQFPNFKSVWYHRMALKTE